jgi:hypothetical protein
MTLCERISVALKCWLCESLCGQDFRSHLVILLRIVVYSVLIPFSEDRAIGHYETEMNAFERLTDVCLFVCLFVLPNSETFHYVWFIRESVVSLRFSFSSSSSFVVAYIFRRG